MDKKTQDNAMMMQGLYWWGVPTLFRCPHNPDPDPEHEKYDPVNFPDGKMHLFSEKPGEGS